jgi:hypothetical protein
MAYQPITEAQIEVARAAGRQRRAQALHAEAVRYDPEGATVEIKLSDALMVRVSRTVLAEWADLPGEAWPRLRLSAERDALAVGDHDVQISIEGLLRAVLPDGFIRRALAHRGGKATSQAKTAAARVNGTAGGRPRKLREPNPLEAEKELA